MKISTACIIRIAAAVATIISIIPSAYAANRTPVENIDSVMKVLDDEIAGVPRYRRAKLLHLDALKRELYDSEGVFSFPTAQALFKEYASFQSDSAFKYATLMRRDAESRGDARDMVRANTAFAEYFVSVGFFKEACEMMVLCESNLLPEDELPDYYYLNARLYQALESYVGGPGSQLWPHYHEIYLAYLDSTVMSAKPGTYMYRFANIERAQLDNHDCNKEAEQRLAMLRRYDMTDHERAINYSLMGRSLLGAGERERSKYYFMQSAIHDIRSNTNETTSAMMLALMAHDDGETQRAYNYITKALDDANYFNTRLRRYEISGYLPAIDAARTDLIRGHVWRLWGVIGVVLGLLALAVFLFSRLRKQNRRINESSAQIERQSEELRQSHSELLRTNDRLHQTLDAQKNLLDKLKETTEIKDRYIMQSLYVNTGFVNQVEERCKELAKEVKDKKYDNLKFISYRMGIKEERQRILKSFDSAFLKLFPNFPEEFNKLFPEDARFVPGPGGELPMEVRIFALLRLGISDPAAVSSYLNLSTKTVYVYKTKVKSRSNVDNADFEARVMAIPKP